MFFLIATVYLCGTAVLSGQVARPAAIDFDRNEYFRSAIALAEVIESPTSAMTDSEDWPEAGLLTEYITLLRDDSYTSMTTAGEKQKMLRRFQLETWPGMAESLMKAGQEPGLSITEVLSSDQVQEDPSLKLMLMLYNCRAGSAKTRLTQDPLAEIEAWSALARERRVLGPILTTASDQWRSHFALPIVEVDREINSQSQSLMSILERDWCTPSQATAIIEDPFIRQMPFYGNYHLRLKGVNVDEFYPTAKQ